MNKKKLYIQTFGCQMNVHDSQKMAAVLSDVGYEETEDPNKADLIILNTCSIREKADQKVASQLGRFRRLKREKPHVVIGVGGCMAQMYGGGLLKKELPIDLVFGTHQIHRLPEMVRSVEGGGGQRVETAFLNHVPSLELRAQPKKGKVCSFVTIMQGCNNYCSYCVVPYLRGPEESRPFAEIIEEVRLLADSGVKEVTLLGQNVNSYGKSWGNGPDFADLIYAIDEIKGIERIRFTTSHPKDLSPKLVDCFGKVASLCEHIHLPVQSGSDRILQLMNRGYTAQMYLEKVAALHEACPEISITSDIIVGFPGEDDTDFQDTLALMKQVHFDNVFSFKYSERRGTLAAAMPNKVSNRVKQERLRILQELQMQHTFEKHRSLVGSSVEVLVEGVSKNSRNEMTGRTRTNKIVNFSGESDLIGKTVSVDIVEAYPHSLRGTLKGDEDVH